MKTSIFYTFVLLFSCLQIAAQDRSLSELLSELEKNHMGAVSDVFTPSEIQTLRQHFAPTNNATPENSGNFDVLSTETQNGNFGHFNRNTPQVFNTTSAAGADDFEGAGIFNPDGELVFLIDNANNAYEINPDTGIYTFLGTVDAPNGESFTGLEINPDNGQLYGISTNGMGSSTISIIDPVTLSVTQIG